MKVAKLETRASALLLVASALMIPLTSVNLVIPGLLLLSGVLLGSIRSLSQAKHLAIHFKHAHILSLLAYCLLCGLSTYSLFQSWGETLYPSPAPRLFVFLPMVYAFGRLSFLGFRFQLRKNYAPGFSIVFLLLCGFFFFFLDFRSLEKLSILVHKFEALPRREEFLILPVTLLVLAVLRSMGGIRKAAQSLVQILPDSNLSAPIASLILVIAVATLTGSSPLTLLAVGPVCLTYLKRSSYGLQSSAAFITAASSLGCLFPPSFMAVLYSMSVSDTPAAISLQDLFRFSTPTGLLCAIAMLVFARPTPEVQDDPKKHILGRSTPASIFPAVLLLLSTAGTLAFVTMGFARIEHVLLGLAAVFFLYALLVRTHPLRLLASVLGPTRSMTAFLPLVLMTFSISDAFALSGFQTRLIQTCETSMSPILFTALWNVILLAVGALMDSVSATILFAPLLGAIATQVYGIYPHWFALNFLINMELGYLVPPVATNLMLASNLFNIHQSAIYRRSTRLLVVLGLALSLTALVSVLQASR